MAKRLAVVGDNVAPGLVDLKRIHQFVILAETLNFRRTAERLNMAQPPLSVSIQKLEEDLGTKLFIRGTGGVSSKGLTIGRVHWAGVGVYDRFREFGSGPIS